MNIETLTEHVVLDAATERALAEAMRAGDSDARHTLWTHNQRLVVIEARRYRDRGMETEDLISEGQLGLARALAKFNPALGYKFSTYAVRWIRQSITRALNNCAPIRLPVHMGEHIARMRHAEARLALALGDWPSDGELAQALGWTAARVAEVREFQRRSQPASLDKPLRQSIGEDEELTIGTTFAAPSDDYAAADDRDERAWVSGLLFAALSTREREVIARRYGLHGAREDYATIGRRYGISRERVRQIAEEALDKLRQHPDVAREQESRRVAA